MKKLFKIIALSGVVALNLLIPVQSVYADVISPGDPTKDPQSFGTTVVCGAIGCIIFIGIIGSIIALIRTRKRKTSK